MHLGRRLCAELTAPPAYSEDREEALLEFAATPYRAEQVLTFGALLAMDSFLWTLTILPLRTLVALWRRRLTIDVVQMVTIAVCFRTLQSVNTSSIYRSMRGQAGITMFVLYSLTDVCDKFLCSVGHEVGACLTSARTARSRRRLAGYALGHAAYVLAHSFVLMWQLVTLNLAVNSYSNALLSFMVTNLFSEIKSAVFKRFTPDSLFQLVCMDITQRFQYDALLTVIVLRNFLEVWFAPKPGAAAAAAAAAASAASAAATGGSSSSGSTGRWSLAALSAIGGPPALVALTMVVVDWLKIAYIVNFNGLRSQELFARYWRLLRDEFWEHTRHRRQSLVSKQVGAPIAPLVIVCVRMFAKGGVILTSVTPVLFVLLLLLKLVLGAWLERITESPSRPASRPASRSVSRAASAAKRPETEAALLEIAEAVEAVQAARQDAAHQEEAHADAHAVDTHAVEDTQEEAKETKTVAKTVAKETKEESDLENTKAEAETKAEKVAPMASESAVASDSAMASDSSDSALLPAQQAPPTDLLDGFVTVRRRRRF